MQMMNDAVKWLQTLGYKNFPDNSLADLAHIIKDVYRAIKKKNKALSAVPEIAGVSGECT